MRPRSSLVILAGGLALGYGAGCAGTPPKETLASADTMVRHAEEEGAPQFAPLPLRQAKDKLEQAQGEMSESEYDSARRLAEQASVDAELASVETDRVRSENEVRELSRTIESMETELGLGPQGTPPVSAPPPGSPIRPTPPPAQPYPPRPEAR